MAPAPVAVSPLIKVLLNLAGAMTAIAGRWFGRYSALLLGIAYGSRHTKTLQKKEDIIMKNKAERAAAEEKKKAAAVAAASEGSIFD